MIHGSIRLIEDRCTSCMICARECPTWCIRLTSHQEQTVPAPGARPRTHNVLDTFTIDWSLCMYCGVCIEQCPTDALEWGDSHVPSADSLVDLVHQREQLAPDA
ncbi:4Fe-4S binding protein [Tessaracoccus flavus]|jgi:NADH-quinone oxidoreductase subunit I|uniref:NADH dehydrogenase n=1 Tax=Tessaracoccus flavus TaxID=1610493 RepID=A0A1Q2CCP2_9ACTN|nr:4Fe-4S binding protein [Tessaracoccus flavus]AQP43867.1 NADH dehydrogenase [Tessaracoccus flavus]SDY26754.1 NADH-quinone oxidoreductase subunit I [Tessaracoccus flavus]